MSMLEEIKSAIEEQGKAWHEYTKTNDEQIAAIRAGNESKAKELGEKLAKIEKDVHQFSELKKKLEIEQQLITERIEELESRAKSPGKTAAQKRADEYKDVFEQWIRNRGHSPIHEQQMQDLQRKSIEAKDVTIGSAAGGGHAVPEEISREIGRLEILKSPVRRLVKVRQVSTSDYKELVSKRGATSGWVGELGAGSPLARPKTNTPQLRERTPTHGELYAYPQVSEWSLDDIFFNVTQWLSEEVSDEFALQEGTAVISGNGTSKPSGLTKSAPVTTADFASPERSADAFQAIESDLTPGGSGILPDALIDLVYKLASPYRMRATWVFNSLTAAAIRKLKDLDGQYLWAPGLQAGQPDRLLGFPLEIWEQMDDVGTNKFPAGFGDWQRAYVLADRIGLRITRDDVTNIGFVRFYIRRRVGGILLDNHAAKFLKTL